MTSEQQITANRRNALRSTGPRTDRGKWTSRQNAFRHGLTAETVVRFAEDADAYSAFEAEVFAEFNPRTVTERELTKRLAALMWRLRRAASVETELFNIQAAIIKERRATQPQDGHDQVHQASVLQNEANLSSVSIAHCFLRLANLGNDILDKISRYESTLWRQTAQTLLILKGMK